MNNIKYVVVVQCHIVKQRCSGYLCEYSFFNRTGAFSIYSKNSKLRFLPMTCGGCCGRAVHRKLNNLIRKIKRKEGITKDDIVVHFSSCISLDNFHGSPCPHKDYLETLVKDKLGLKVIHGSRINKVAEKRRNEGIYERREEL